MGEIQRSIFCVHVIWLETRFLFRSVTRNDNISWLKVNFWLILALNQYTKAPKTWKCRPPGQWLHLTGGLQVRPTCASERGRKNSMHADSKPSPLTWVSRLTQEPPAASFLPVACIASRVNRSRAAQFNDNETH